MTSKEQSIARVEECAKDEIVSLIEKHIGTGFRDWRDTKWGDGKVRVSFLEDKFTERQVSDVIRAYEELGWTVERKREDPNRGEYWHDDHKMWIVLKFS